MSCPESCTRVSDRRRAPTCEFLKLVGGAENTSPYADSAPSPSFDPVAEGECIKQLCTNSNSRSCVPSQIQ